MDVYLLNHLFRRPAKFCRGCYNASRWMAGVLVRREPPFSCPNCGCEEFVVIGKPRLRVVP